METTCGSLLSELQKIWDEIGETEVERDRMILELEQECLQLYRRQVDQTSKHRAQLRKAVADTESELAFICAALGEPPMHIKQNAGSLKMQLQTISSLLDEMQRKKKERKSMFTEVVEQINHIVKELQPSDEANKSLIVIDESDLSLKKLEDLKTQFHDLEKEKSKRLKLVFDQLSKLSSLCMVLGLDFKLTVSEIHPTLDDSHGSRSISSHTIEKLSTTIRKLNDLKMQRLEKLQNLAATMVELWCLMDIPVEEQQRFQNVTRNIAASANEIIEPNSLSLDFIKYAEAEVSRLQEMKSSKIKEVLLKKRRQLEQLCREAHMVVDDPKSIDYYVETIESGAIDPTYLLDQIEVQISKAKEEAFSRKELLEKIEKWLAACEEESWLEEYNRDDNRYNAGRGAHLMLKRAERARALVNKIPAMLELLTTKAKAWEKQRGVEFLYDGVRLLYMLDQYRILQQEKEQERQRERDQKKLHGQLMVEKEVLFGSRPSPSNSGRKNAGSSTVGANNKRFSVGGVMLQNSHPEKAMFFSHAYNKSSDYLKQPNMRNIQQSKSAVLSSGKRNTPGLPSKKPSNIGSNKKSTESKLIRKPLSPLSSFSYQVNNDNLPYDRYERKENQDVINKAALPVTPNKVVSAFGGCETTPKKLPITAPSTPPTVSAAMQMAMTPATPYIASGNRGMERSFEERRAGFIAF